MSTFILKYILRGKGDDPQLLYLGVPLLWQCFVLRIIRTRLNTYYFLLYLTSISVNVLLTENAKNNRKDEVVWELVKSAGYEVAQL